MTTKVVNLNVEDYDVYIGRPSKWGNPFRIGPDGTRKDVIKKYRDYILQTPELHWLTRKAGGFNRPDIRVVQKGHF